MSVQRPFVCEDLFRFNKVNLDPLTETYGLSFYFEYMARWPEYFTVVENSDAQITGYSAFVFRLPPPSPSVFFFWFPLLSFPLNFLFRFHDNTHIAHVHTQSCFLLQFFPSPPLPLSLFVACKSLPLYIIVSFIIVINLKPLAPPLPFTSFTFNSFTPNPPLFLFLFYFFLVESHGQS